MNRFSRAGSRPYRKTVRLGRGAVIVRTWEGEMWGMGSVSWITGASAVDGMNKYT